MSSPPRLQNMTAPTQEEVLRTLLDTMPDIIYAKDLQSRFVMCNAALAQLVGVAQVEEILGKTDADFFPNELVAHYLEDERRIFQTGTPLVNREEPTVGVDGHQRWDSTTKIPVHDSTGQVCGLVGITRDVTEQKWASELLEQTNAALQLANEQLKAAQFQLIQFEKAQSLSRLAAGLAHEIKNPLAILEMGLSFVADEVVSDSGKVILESMHDAVSRANRVIADVMQLAEGQTVELRRVKLNVVLEAALAKMEPELQAAHIEVDWPRNEALSPVPLDPIHFKEVLSHIFTNARQAMPQGGKLSVRTTQYTLSPQDVSHELGNRSGVRFRAGDEILLLEIQDTGHGIPEQNRSAVFDAFFTTKPAGTAVGLGLTVSRKIMELHGGSIELSHPESGGTCVTLRLKQ